MVEVGNTQALGFADAGLFADLSDIDLGGDDLLPGLVAAGTYDGALYAAPYYAGGRIVFYTPQIVGDTLPATLDEYVAQGIELKTDTVSGIYAPGKDWYNALPYVWAHGGEIAVQDGDEWDAQFSSDESIEGLEQLQDVYLNASVAPVDGNESLGNIDFCAGEVGFLSSPAWAAGNITGAGRGVTRLPAKRFRGLPRHLRQGPRRVRAARVSRRARPPRSSPVARTSPSRPRATRPRRPRPR